MRQVERHEVADNHVANAVRIEILEASFGESGLKDLADWAPLAGLAIKMPPTVFPVNSIKAMRGCLWLGNDAMVPFARSVFEAYWRDDRDISQDEVVRDICESVGADAGLLLEAIS